MFMRKITKLRGSLANVCKNGFFFPLAMGYFASPPNWTLGERFVCQMSFRQIKKIFIARENNTINSLYNMGLANICYGVCKPSDSSTVSNCVQSGVVLRTKKCTQIRPLLSLSRLETGKFCSFWQLPIYPDTSNQKVKFLRNRVRKQLLPAIKLFFNSRIETVLLQFAELFEAEDWYMNQITKELWQYHTRDSISFKSQQQANVLLMKPTQIETFLFSLFDSEKISHGQKITNILTQIPLKHFHYNDCKIKPNANNVFLFRRWPRKRSKNDVWSLTQISPIISKYLHPKNISNKFCSIFIPFVTSIGSITPVSSIASITICTSCTSVGCNGCTDGTATACTGLAIIEKNSFVTFSRTQKSYLPVGPKLYLTNCSRGRRLHIQKNQHHGVDYVNKQTEPSSISKVSAFHPFHPTDVQDVQLVQGVQQDTNNGCRSCNNKTEFCVFPWCSMPIGLSFWPWDKRLKRTKQYTNKFKIRGQYCPEYASFNTSTQILFYNISAPNRLLAKQLLRTKFYTNQKSIFYQNTSLSNISYNKKINTIFIKNFFAYFDLLEKNKKEIYWPVILSFLPPALQRRVVKLFLTNANWQKIQYSQVENFLATHIKST